MSSKPPESQSSRRDLALGDDGAADIALEKLRPLLKPDKEREARIVLTRTISKVHSGPIPSAEEMEHLEAVLPGSADRCFRMAEKEQDHRHSCDRDILKKEFAFRGRGQLLAILAVALLLAAVAFIARLGDTKSAAALGTATLVGIVYAFTKSKQIESGIEEAEKKPAQMQQNSSVKKASGKRR